jgi:DNA-binding NarL/FixJ family response regulator
MHKDPTPGAKRKKRSSTSIRLVVIEDNRLLREGISAMLSEQPDISVTGAFGTGENLLQKLGKLTPNVLLLDLGLRNQNSLRLVESMKREVPLTRTIVMDLVPMQADIMQFVRAGVSGFVLKDASAQDFLNTVRAVAHGAKVLPSHLTDSLFSQIVEDALNGSTKAPSGLIDSIRMTKREREVIHLVADALSNKDIADRLHLSPYTVKSHIHNILEKLALRTRVQIAHYAHTSQDFRTALSPSPSDD